MEIQDDSRTFFDVIGGRSRRAARAAPDRRRDGELAEDRPRSARTGSPHLDKPDLNQSWKKLTESEERLVRRRGMAQGRGERGGRHPAVMLPAPKQQRRTHTPKRRESRATSGGDTQRGAHRADIRVALGLITRDEMGAQERDADLHAHGRRCVKVARGLLSREE